MSKNPIALELTGTIPIEEFPILKHGLYANHAAIAPWPLATAQAVARFAQENCENGAAEYRHWLHRETQLKRALARMINADSYNDIALLKNTTEGICTVANGIDWRHGDNLVLPADEFPSNRLPWLALEHQGVEIREVDIRATNEPEKRLLNQIDERTRLLSVSAVQWTDGLRLNLETLGKSCRKAGTLFFVDAIQQLGALEMDVKTCHIDFLAADGHKWLLSPEGIAVFFCRKEVRNQLRPSQLGWRMVDDPYQFNRDDWQASKTASCFEAGSPNNLGQAAMYASVGLLQQFGMQQVEACITTNSMALSNGLGSIQGIELVRPFNATRVSGIISFKTTDIDLQGFYQLLQQQGLSCALRGGAIRLSPHFYQFGQPIQKILECIEHSKTRY